MKIVFNVNRGGARLGMRMSALLLFLAACAPAILAQGDRERVEGVKNFGRVTEGYFRGGAITSEGIENLAAMGVRTIVDLRDNASASESKICARLGIRYVNFPMTGHDAPEDRVVDEVLSIIQTGQNAKEPVYVHCAAGKHRAGTMAALYRIRVQGWTKERAWSEQQSYGFGSPDGHPELYAYVYGGERGAREAKLAKSKKDDDNDDDEKAREESKKDRKRKK